MPRADPQGIHSRARRGRIRRAPSHVVSPAVIDPGGPTRRRRAGGGPASGTFRISSRNSCPAGPPSRRSSPRSDAPRRRAEGLGDVSGTAPIDRPPVSQGHARTQSGRAAREPSGDRSRTNLNGMTPAVAGPAPRPAIRGRKGPRPLRPLSEGLRPPTGQVRPFGPLSEGGSVPRPDRNGPDRVGGQSRLLQTDGPARPVGGRSEVTGCAGSDTSPRSFLRAPAARTGHR
jgi:hypothetical protein